MYLATSQLLDAMLDALKSELDGGFLYIFAGTLPANAAAALDTGAIHTQVAQLTESNDGTTGLTFETAAGGLLVKEGTETWEATITFDGADAAETTLTPTFFRFCPTGDDGRGAASGPRLQGTVGGPSSGMDLRLGADTLTDNGTNTVGVGIFEVGIGSVA